jgi:hypothetical protein
MSPVSSCSPPATAILPPAAGQCHPNSTNASQNSIVTTHHVCMISPPPLPPKPKEAKPTLPGGLGMSPVSSCLAPATAMLPTAPATLPAPDTAAPTAAFMFMGGCEPCLSDLAAALLGWLGLQEQCHDNKLRLHGNTWQYMAGRQYMALEGSTWCST